MRRVLCLAFAVAFLSTSLPAKQQQPDPLLPCPPGASSASCNPSRVDEKEAKAAFARGLKLQEKDIEQAYEQFARAAQLVPRDVNYVTAREVALQRLVTKHIELGNAELESGKQIEAVADFRNALHLDPSN